MNGFRGIVLLVMALSFAACGDEPEDITGEGDAIVSMPGFSFVPFTTQIARGETVTFDFPSQRHNVIFDDVTGAPPDIQETSNRSVTRKFDVAGDFPYDCTLHPGMSGIVLVR